MRRWGTRQTMSKAALETLRTIGFLDKKNRAVDFSDWEHNRLLAALQYYFECRTRVADQELKQIPDVEGTAGFLSSVSGANSVYSLLPSLLCFSQMITDDPVFRMSIPDDPFGLVQKQAMGMPTVKNLDASWLVNKVSYFAELAPAIEAGFIVVLPLQLLHLPPEQLPVFYSEDAFRSEVPDHIHDYIHQCAQIRTVVPDKTTGALLIHDEAPAHPIRAIHVSFKGDESANSGMIYFLQQMELLGKDEDTQCLHIRYECDLDKPVDESRFKIWVYQSINRTIINRLRSVASEISLARSLGFSYLTESRFEADILGASGSKEELSSSADRAANAVNFLNANMPRVYIDSTATVVRLRVDRQDTFSRFHASLLEVSANLQGLSPAEFKLQAKQLFARVIDPQLREIEKDASRLAATVVKGATFSAGALALAMAGDVALPFAAVVAFWGAHTIAESLPAVSDYLHQRRGPEYIWRRLTK